MGKASPVRAIISGRLTSLLGTALLSACAVVPPVAPPPSAPPPPQAVPLPPPPPPVIVAPEKPWDIAPLSAGDWTYSRDQQGPTALFGPRGAAPSLEIRCRPATRQIAIARLGGIGQSVTMTIRTSAGDLAWPASPAPGGVQTTIATRPAADPGFDKIAFSRGRMSVEVPGLARLIVPVWAELQRVIEDCRG